MSEEYLMNDAIREAVERGRRDSFKLPEDYDGKCLMCSAIREANEIGRDKAYKLLQKSL